MTLPVSPPAASTLMVTYSLSGAVGAVGPGADGDVEPGSGWTTGAALINIVAALSTAAPVVGTAPLRGVT
ncbi:hypothetical protein D3C81_1367740 [compost metagenome]